MSEHANINTTSSKPFLAALYRNNTDWILNRKCYKAYIIICKVKTSKYAIVGRGLFPILLN